MLRILLGRTRLLSDAELNSFFLVAQRYFRSISQHGLKTTATNTYLRQSE